LDRLLKAQKRQILELLRSAKDYLASTIWARQPVA